MAHRNWIAFLILAATDALAIVGLIAVLLGGDFTVVPETWAGMWVALSLAIGAARWAREQAGGRR